MTAKDYALIAVALVAGVAFGILARGVSDQKGWTTA